MNHLAAPSEGIEFQAFIRNDCLSRFGVGKMLAVDFIQNIVLQEENPKGDYGIRLPYDNRSFLFVTARESAMRLREFPDRAAEALRVTKVGGELTIILSREDFLAIAKDSDTLRRLLNVTTDCKGFGIELFEPDHIKETPAQTHVVIVK